MKREIRAGSVELETVATTVRDPWKIINKKK